MQRVMGRKGGEEEGEREKMENCFSDLAFFQNKREQTSWIRWPPLLSPFSLSLQEHEDRAILGVWGWRISGVMKMPAERRNVQFFGRFCL